MAGLNKALTIKHCLESLLSLKEPPAKIMVVDGYSKDGTYEILKEYGEKIELHQFPKNLSATFNWSFDKIKTEYVALTDGDCQVAPDWLEELLKGFEEENAVAAAGYCGTPENASVLQKIIGQELESRFKKLPKYISRAPTMNLCLKTEIAQKVRFDEEQTVGVEVDFGWRLAKLGKIVYVPKAKVFHYHRADLKSYFFQQKNQTQGMVKIFFKHGGRTFGDKITPLSMTLQMPLFAAGLTGLVLSFFNGLFLYASLVFFLILFTIYLINIIEIKPSFHHWPAFLGLFALRTCAWMTGLIQGIWLTKKSF